MSIPTTYFSILLEKSCETHPYLTAITNEGGEETADRLLDAVSASLQDKVKPYFRRLALQRGPITASSTQAFRRIVDDACDSLGIGRSTVNIEYDTSSSVGYLHNETVWYEIAVTALRQSHRVRMQSGRQNGNGRDLVTRKKLVFWNT